MSTTVLSNRQAYTKVIALAWPAIVENIMITMVNYVDTAMVGSLGKNATSAVAINASPMWLINSISMAVWVGSSVMVARAYGAGDPEKAGAYSRQSLVLSTVLGLFISVLVFILAPWIPLWMRSDGAIHADAADYMRIMACVLLPHYLSMTINATLRGSGNTKTPMRITFLVNLLNVFGNLLLIFPVRTINVFSFQLTLWGAGMGVQGAAISTAVCITIGCILLFFHLARHDGALRISLRHSFRLHIEDLKDMMRIGLPAAAERVSMSLGNTFFTSMVAGLGVAELAAHHLAITAESICFNPVYGFSTAATTMVGQSIGAKDYDLAQRFGRINIHLGFIVMSLAGAMLFLVPNFLIGIFTPDPEVIDLGAKVLRIIAFSEPFFGLAIVASGALRGAGDTVVALVIGTICIWGVRIGLAYLLTQVFMFGLTGAWIAMGVDLILRGLLIYLRFRSGKWKRKLVDPTHDAIAMG